MPTLAPTAPGDVRALLQSLDVWHGPLPSAELAARSPDRLLSRVLSLAETVRIGADLVRLPSAPTDAPSTEGHERWSVASRMRLSDGRRRIDHIYAQAFTRRGGLPDAARMHAMLVDLGALGDRPAERARVAAMWAASYAQLFGGLVAQLRRELELFKYDLVPKLRDEYPHAAVLLHIDASLEAAIGRITAEALRSLNASLEARCTMRFDHAIAALPADCSAAALQPWFSARGSAIRLHEQCRRLCHALFDLEWSALQGLIDAVCLPTPRAGCAP